VICVISVVLGIVLIGAALLASAAAGALAVIAIHSRDGARPAHDRQSRSARVTSGVSLVTSATMLTVKATTLACTVRRR
jgi:hypothetical protein